MSRDYSKVLPSFWTGDTGKWLRKQGAECQVVAFYLLTCPGANMIGLYYLPIPTLCHETGLTQKGASKALARLSEGEFAYFDQPKEEVWVPQMARFQIGESLKPNDKVILGIERLVSSMRKSKFFSSFVTLYGDAYHLSDAVKKLAEGRPIEGPSKALRSQDQDQETDQEQESAPDNPAPLPFTVAQAQAHLAEAGRFVALKLNRGQTINAQRLIRENPDPAAWKLVGAWLAAGGESWRQTVDGRALGDFSAWLTHAEKWHAEGRPRVLQTIAGGKRPTEPQPRQYEDLGDIARRIGGGK